MSKYTTQLRYICESLTDNKNTCNIDEIVKGVYSYIFDDFPLFDETHREELCCKILKHFYFHEICYDSVAKWRFAINRKLNEIMPLYNQRFKSESVEFNPLYNIELIETYNYNDDEQSENTANSESESNSHNNSKNTASGAEVQSNTADSEINSKNSHGNITKSNTLNKSVTDKKDMFSDTPQGKLSDVENGEYLSEYRNNKDNSSVSNSHNEVVNGSDNSNQNTKRTEKNVLEFENRVDETTGDTSSGSKSTAVNESKSNKQGGYTKKTVGSSAGLPFSKALQQWRDIMLNIDMEIIAELENFFIMIW